MRKLYLIALLFSYIFFTGCDQKPENREEANHHDHSGENTHDHQEAEHTHSHQDNEHDHSAESEEHSHPSEEDEDQHDHDQNYSKEDMHSHDEHEEDLSHESHSDEKDYHIETIETRSFNEVVRTSGEILSLPRNETVLVSPVSGVVHFASNSVLPGKEVQNNDVLFYISSESVAEGNLFLKFQKAEVTYQKAKNDFHRAEKLLKDQLVSEKEYLSHKSDYLNAKAEYEALKEHFSGESGVVRSKRTGYIHDLFVSEGDYVKTGQKIASVVKEDKLLLKAEVSQMYASRMDEFVAANFQTPDGKLYSTEELEGKVLSMGRSIAGHSFYLPIYFEIDRHPKLVPGSFVHVYLIGKEKQDVIALPKEAFIEEQGNFFVFTRKGEELIKTAVKTGRSNGKLILVESGVKPGNEVVTRGAYHVKLMKAASSLPSHGHSH